MAIRNRPLKLCVVYARRVVFSVRYSCEIGSRREESSSRDGKGRRVHRGASFPNHGRFLGGMRAMKLCRVIVDLMQMNRRRFVVRRDRYIPFARERSAHVGFDSVQRFV